MQWNLTPTFSHRAVLARWLSQGWRRIGRHVRTDLRVALNLPEPTSKVILLAEYRQRAVRRG